MRTVKIDIEHLVGDIPKFIRALKFLSEHIEDMYLSYGTGYYDDYDSYQYFYVCGKSKISRTKLQDMLEDHLNESKT